MSSTKPQWVMKDENGKLRGPFSTEKIISLIRVGDISGTEKIAKYPGGDFVPISSDVTFYDHLLNALEEDNNENSETGLTRASEAETVITKMNNMTESTQTGILKKSGKILDVGGSELTKFGSGNKDTVTEASTKTADKGEVIDLKDLKKERNREEIKKAKAPMIFIGVILLVGIYLVFFMGPSRDGKGNLLAPRKGQAKISKKEVKTKIGRAAKYFERDTYSDYISAQNILVQVVEGAPDNVNARELLCLTYRELWPFVNQDSKDLQTVAHVSQSTQALDPAGPYGLQCRIVNLFINGRYQEAKSVIETGLDEHPGVIILYLMRGETDLHARDYDQARAYVEKMQESWPNYVKTYVVLSTIYERLQRLTDAAIALRKALKLNKDHPVAKIKLALLEKNSFDHPDVAYDLISSALRREEEIPRTVLAEAYLGLSEINYLRKKKSAALEAAQRAYAINSSLPGAREMVIRLGGKDKLSETKVSDQELVYIGDQYFQAGNYFAAQAEYKVAFENDGKNGVAALKAAESLWKLSQSSEAIQWAKKAIKADKRLIRAYTTLADYYSRRYNFIEAAQTLKVAQQLAPKNYIVYRGYARLENRRKNMQGAIRFAQRSIRYYDADPITYIILADSYLGLREFEKAHSFAIKAKELDPTNVDAQITYSKVLAGYQGYDSAIYYMIETSRKYRHVKEYLIGLGDLYLADERFPEAEEQYIKVLSIDENNKAANLQRGKALQAQGRLEQALEAFLTAAQLDPSDGEPIFHAGLLYMDFGKPNEAMMQFQRVLRINKYYPRAHYFIGKAALRKKPPEPKLALEQATLERKVNPNLADAYLLSAEAFHLIGQYSACAGEYQKAIRLRPQGADIYVRLARCYRKAGSLDVADSMLAVAHEKESGMPEIYKEQGALFQLRGQFLEAIKSYEQYLVLSPNARDKGEIEAIMAKLGGM